MKAPDPRRRPLPGQAESAERPSMKEEFMKSARVGLVLLLALALVSAGCEEGGGFPGGTTGKGAVLGGLLGA